MEETNMEKHPLTKPLKKQQMEPNIKTKRQCNQER